MTMATPDWIEKRGGQLRYSADGAAATVYLNGTPLYLLRPIPAKGKWACRITQTNNGHRLDKADLVYGNLNAAFEGGLNQLQEMLGW